MTWKEFDRKQSELQLRNVIASAKLRKAVPISATAQPKAAPRIEDSPIVKAAEALRLESEQAGAEQRSSPLMAAVEKLRLRQQHEKVSR